MAKVLCTLPNASDLINGVRFISHADGMLSEDVADDVAAAFTEIKGYSLAGEKKAPAPVPPAPVPPAPAPAPAPADQAADSDQTPAAKADEKTDEDAAMEALRQRAAAVELRVDARWKIERLTAEVEKAEKAKAGA